MEAIYEQIMYHDYPDYPYLDFGSSTEQQGAWINEGLIAQANEALEARELIKCSVLDASELTAREACDELCARTGAEPVQVIGHKFSVYRPTHRKDVKKIELD